MHWRLDKAHLGAHMILVYVFSNEQDDWFP